MEGLKNRIANFKRHLKERVRHSDQHDTTVREEHGSQPVGRMEERLSGSKRERIKEKVDKTKNQSI